MKSKKEAVLESGGKVTWQNGVDEALDRLSTHADKFDARDMAAFRFIASLARDKGALLKENQVFKRVLMALLAPMHSNWDTVTQRISYERLRDYPNCELRIQQESSIPYFTVTLERKL